MAKTVALHELDDEQAYEGEIRHCVGVTGYHHWFFLRAMSDALGLKFRAFAVESGGEPLGVVPLLLRQRGPVSTVNFLPIGCIGPMLRGDALRAGRARELLGAVQPVLRGKRAVVTRWAFSPGLNLGVEQLTMPGFKVAVEENYSIPATMSVDDCWKSMSQLRRRSIRKCDARGIYATQSSAEEITRWLPDQIREVYSRQGTLAAYKQSEARAITAALAADPRLLWRTVKDSDGEVLGMSGCIVSDDRVDNWLMAGPHVPGISMHTVAYWDLINWALTRGLTLDTGGAPTAGVRQFKTSIGAELETVATVVRIRPETIYRAGRAIYNWSAGCLGRLQQRQKS
jgi:hypothetical protein